MEQLTNLYGQTTQGKAQIVLVDGAVASGKTELLHTFGEQVVEPDGLMLTATGSRAERSLPFGVLGQLFHNSVLPAHVKHDVSALLDEYTHAAVDDNAPGAPRASVVELARRLFLTLLGLCAEQPVIIGIDDVHYVDPPSLDVLLYLLRRLKTNRLMVILNELTGPRPAHPTFLAELFRLPNCHRIQLQMLSVDGVAEVLASVLDQPTVDDLAPAYHAMSGGNPLLLRGLAEDSVVRLPDDTETLSSQPRTSESFRQAMFACLYRWDRATIDVAHGLATMGEWATPTLLGRLAQLKPETVQQSLDTLTRSGLLENGRFRHQAMRSVVLDSLGVEDRVRKHLAAAQLLYHSGVLATMIAEHLISAGQIDDQWAIAVLRDAAKLAEADDRIDFALRCLELAHRSCTDPRQRAHLTMSLAVLEWRNQPSTAARHLAPMRQALIEGHLARKHAFVIVRHLGWQGQSREARETVQWLLDSGGASDPAMAADIRCLRMRLEPELLPAVLKEMAAEPTACQGPDEQIHVGLTAASAFGSVLHEGPSERALEQAEQVLSGCQLTDETFHAIVAALHALIYADRPDRAEPWCQVFLAQARDRRAAVWEAMFTIVKAETALRRGKLAEAEQDAHRALRLISPHNWGVMISYPLSVLLHSQTALGKYEDAVQTLRQVLPESIYENRAALRYLHARGHFFLATKRLQAALADFRKCGELTRLWSLDLPALVPWRSDSAQVQLSLGNPREAEELIREQLELPGGNGPRTRGIALRVLAKTKDTPQRPAVLRESIELLQQSGDTMELVLALADLSTVHRALGEHNMSQMLERRVLRAAKECGAQGRGQRLLGGQDATEPKQSEHARPTDALVLLSNAERRVAALAAQGHTNRQISRKLYITVSTVEQHLTRVYRKLNVNRRADLPLWLKEEDEETFEGPHLVPGDALVAGRTRR